MNIRVYIANSVELENYAVLCWKKFPNIIFQMRLTYSRAYLSLFFLSIVISNHESSFF